MCIYIYMHTYISIYISLAHSPTVNPAYLATNERRKVTIVHAQGHRVVNGHDAVVTWHLNLGGGGVGKDRTHHALLDLKPPILAQAGAEQSL